MTTKSFLLACSVAAALLGSGPGPRREPDRGLPGRGPQRPAGARSRGPARRRARGQAAGACAAAAAGQRRRPGLHGQFRWRVDLSAGEPDHGQHRHGRQQEFDRRQPVLGLPRRTDPDRVPLGPVAGTEARRFAGGGGRGDVSRRAAGPARARRAGLFRRAGRRGHARRRAGDARSVQPAARAGREAFRSRPDRRHRRAGIARRARQRDGRRHCRQARAGDRAGSAARTHRQGLPVAGEAGRADAAQQAGPGRTSRRGSTLRSRTTSTWSPRA